MKSPLAFGLLLSLTSAPALAAQTLYCKPLQTYPNEFRLQIDSAKDTASIYQLNIYDKKPMWESVYKNASLAVAADGGPIHVSGRDERKVDWSKAKSCYVMLKPNYSFTLRGHGQRYTGTFRLLPNIQVKPNSTCSVPRPMVPPPISLDCEVQKNLPAPRPR